MLLFAMSDGRQPAQRAAHIPATAAEVAREVAREIMRRRGAEEDEIVTLLGPEPKTSTEHTGT